MSKLGCILSFSVGAAIGSVATWKLIKTKYEHMAQEEIEIVRDVYRNKMEQLTGYTEPVEEPDNQEETQDETAKSEMDEYVDILKKTGYCAGETTKGSGENMKTKPYVISPEDFGEVDYKKVELTYYADRVLADPADEIITEEEIEDIIGLESLETFGEYEDDSVYVRNDELETDYEILLDMRNYSDVFGS